MKTRSYRGANTGVWATHGFAAPPDTLSKGPTWAIELPINRGFGHDMVLAQSRGESASGYIDVCGDKGAGKTVAAKVQATMSSALQAFAKDGTLVDQSIHVHNRKLHDDVAEWLEIVKTLGGSEISLAEQAFDVFDSSVSYNENFSRAVEIFEYVLDRPNSNADITAMRAAVHRLRVLATPFISLAFIGALRTITHEDVQAIRVNDDVELEVELDARAADSQVARDQKAALIGSQITEASFLDIKQAGEQLADALSNIRDPEGPFGRLLSGSKPFSSLQRSPAMIINYYNMKGKQVGLIELLRMQGEAYDPSLRPNIAIEEEIHLALKGNVPLLKRFADETSVARSFDQRKYFLSQYPDNYLSGDEGSAERGYAQQFYRGFDVHEIFQLPNDQKILDLLSLLNLSRTDIEFITGQNGQLEPGTCLYVPKNQSARRIFTYASEDFIEKYGKSRQATEAQVKNRRHVDDFGDDSLPWIVKG